MPKIELHDLTTEDVLALGWAFGVCLNLVPTNPTEQAMRARVIELANKIDNQLKEQ